MNYNHFTVSYINSIKNNLCISINSKGEAEFYPEKINASNILNLKIELEKLWKEATTAIEIIENKQDATIQAGLFGLINDLDKALKVGFLIADRVVLIDYLFERILSKNLEKIDYTHLGVIASSLVNILPLAENGRVVIIPNPFKWNEKSKEIIAEVASKTMLTPELMSLLNMLSITKRCKLHPYTIAESKDRYASIIDNQIDHVNAIGKDAGQYAYEGILGALLSERILDETNLNVALNIPISEYFNIVSSNKEFYRQYLTALTQGDSLNAQNNIDNIKQEIKKALEEQNRRYIESFKKGVNIIGGVGGGAIGLLGAVSIISAPLSLVGAVLSFSPTLISLMKDSNGNNNPALISVFSNLQTYE